MKTSSMKTGSVKTVSTKNGNMETRLPYGDFPAIWRLVGSLRDKMQWNMQNSKIYEAKKHIEDNGRRSKNQS